MHKILLSTGNVFISLVLGALLFGYVFIRHPDQMETILKWASGLKHWLTDRGLSPQYNNWIRVLLEERQLVFMGFTIIARIALASLASLAALVTRAIYGRAQS